MTLEVSIHILFLVDIEMDSYRETCILPSSPGGGNSGIGFRFCIGCKTKKRSHFWDIDAKY